MFRFLKDLIRRDYDAQVRSWRSDLAGVFHVIVSILVFPVRVLFYPFEVAFKSLTRPADDHGPYDQPNVAPQGLLAAIVFWTKKVLTFLVMLPLHLIRAPFEFFRALAASSRRDILFLLPALLMIGFFCFVFYQVWQGGDAIEQRYKAGAQQALADGKFPLAKTFFSRIVGERPLSAAEKFQWALILAQNGDDQRADRLFAELAPDDRKNFPPAHRMKALALAAQLAGNVAGPKDPLVLKKLRSHLNHSDDQSNPIQQAWAIYYLAVDDVDNATRYLRSAAESDPRFWLTIADINHQKGRPVQRDQAIKKAETEYRQRVESDPLDVDSRLALAKVLTQSQQIEDAEQLLLTGLKLQPSPQLRREMASFYLLRQALAAADKKGDFEQQFALIQKAIAMDPNFPPIYHRLGDLYGKVSDDDDREAIRKSLYDMVTGDRPSPTAHLVLSNLLWIDGERADAQWHVEQAYSLEPNYAVVINNLAYMISQSENPDLERAEELILSILKKSPNDHRFIDTYANILMKQQRYEEAVTQFQKALPNTSNPAEVSVIHANLAKCYEALGKSKLAELHRQKLAGLEQ